LPLDQLIALQAIAEKELDYINGQLPDDDDKSCHSYMAISRFLGDQKGIIKSLISHVKDELEKREGTKPNC
jgi:hypothetical protein